MFKLLDSFESVLDRDLIASSAQRLHLSLVRYFASDMEEVQLRNETPSAPSTLLNSFPDCST
jgi:hypothetical protein